MEEFINQYGNISSILALIFVIIGFINKQIQKFRDLKDQQDKEYQEVKEEIKLLASNASTITQRQDVFMYVNSSVNFGRHRENRMRIRATTNYIISFITFLLTINVILFIKLSILEDILFIILDIALIISVYKINTILEQLGSINDSFAEGYIETISNHIEQTISNKSLERNI